MKHIILLLLLLNLPIFAQENIENETNIPPFNSEYWLSDGLRQGDRTPFSLKPARKTSLFVSYDGMFEAERKLPFTTAVFAIILWGRESNLQVNEMHPQSTFERSFFQSWFWKEASGIPFPRNLDRGNRYFRGLNW
ncbi:MAG: hypothetical protein FWE23_01195 [Chitinivibrionia bacterium]|nr:hypothetical protein [Chitinivibrionia bacterium]